jgi:hypothetical protein
MNVNEKVHIRRFFFQQLAGEYLAEIARKEVDLR